ncbi:MAG: putative quinol monooxygenase [Dehalococcoidia bacterium]
MTNSGSVIVVLAPLRASPGKGDELVKLYKELLPLVRREKGTLAYSLYRQQNDCDRFVLFEKYVDKQSSECHCSTDYLREFADKSGPILISPVDFSKQRFYCQVH